MKLLKRLSAALVAGVVAIAAVPNVAFAGEARDAEIAAYADGTAYLTINNSDWADFEATYTTAEITGDGTYTVSMEAKEAQNLAQFNALQVKNGENVMGNKSIVTVDEIKINGEKIEMAGYSYTCAVDGKGPDTRVNLYNEWNKPTDDSGNVAADTRCTQDATKATAMLWGADKLEGFKSVEVTFTVSDFGKNEAAPAVKEKVAEPLPAEGTPAYITFSDTAWANQWWNDGKEYATVTMNKATVTGEGEYTVSAEIKAAADAPAKGFAFIDTVHAPPGLYTLTEGIEHRTLLLIEWQRLQYFRLQDSHIGDDAVVCDTLLLTIIVDDGIAGGLRTSACRGGNGYQFHPRVPVFLIQIDVILSHLAVELDALSHIHGASASYGEDGIALGNLKDVHALTNILIERIWGELVEYHVGYGHVFYLILDTQIREGGVAHKENLGATV